MVFAEILQKVIELIRLHKYKLGLLTLCVGELLTERYNIIIFVYFKDHYGAMLLLYGQVEISYVCVLFLCLGVNLS